MESVNDSRNHCPLTLLFHFCANGCEFPTLAIAITQLKHWIALSWNVFCEHVMFYCGDSQKVFMYILKN